MPPRTTSRLPLNLSPKVAVDLVASIVGYLLAYYVASVNDPTLSAAIGKAIGSFTAYWAPPGRVT